MKKTVILIFLSAVLLLLPACADEYIVTPPEIPPGTPAAPDTQASPDPLNPPDTQPPSAEDSDITSLQPNSPDNGIVSGTPAQATGEVIISFDYTRQSGAASNQHAVWIEDTDGNFIKSLFASRWTANGGYKTRHDSIFIWAERAGLANMSKDEIDAVAGASPRTGAQLYTWDLTDLSGDSVLQGDYIIYVEGTLRWKNYVLYSGVIPISDSPVTVQCEAAFHYEATGRYDALTAESGENNMIGPVTVTFTP